MDQPEAVSRFNERLRTKGGNARKLGDVENFEFFIWGQGSRNRLGNGNTKVQPVPRALRTINCSGNVASVALGRYHSVLLTDAGEILTWGESSYGQLGHLDKKTEKYPRLVDKLAKTMIIKISAGATHTAALSDQGILYTWGEGLYGRLGHGSDQDLLFPKPLERFCMDATVVSVVCGASFTLAVASNGDVYTFGQGSHGRLGHGDDNNRETPTRVESLCGRVFVVQADCGESHCAVCDRDGDAFVWGNGLDGRLGLGDDKTQPLPVKITALNQKGVVQMACGERHTMALLSNGQVYSWGRGDYGRLGFGNIKDEKTPKMISFLSKKSVVMIAAGSSHSVALTAKGLIFSWGDGGSGRLGHDDDRDQKAPTIVKALYQKHVHFAACGWEHTAAIVGVSQRHTVDDDKKKKGEEMAIGAAYSTPEGFDSREEYYYHLFSAYSPTFPAVQQGDQRKKVTKGGRRSTSAAGQRSEISGEMSSSFMPQSSVRPFSAMAESSAGPGSYKMSTVSPTGGGFPLAQRFGEFVAIPTPGPGSYNARSGGKGVSITAAHKRNRREDTIPTPGPGAYTHFQSVGEESPAYTFGRPLKPFTQESGMSPGPAHYNVKRELTESPGPMYSFLGDSRSGGWTQEPSTPWHLGPGSYRIKDKPDMRKMSLGVRRDLTKDTDLIPGPGQYDSHVAVSNVRGSSPCFSFGPSLNRHLIESALKAKIAKEEGKEAPGGQDFIEENIKKAAKVPSPSEKKLYYKEKAAAKKARIAKVLEQHRIKLEEKLEYKTKVALKMDMKREQERLANNKNLMDQHKKRKQKMWASLIALAAREKILYDCMVHGRATRSEWRERNNAARMIQRNARPFINKKRNARMAKSGGVLRKFFDGPVYLWVVKRRAQKLMQGAKVLSAFLEDQATTKSITRAIRSFRYKVILLQRHFRSILEVKEGQIAALTKMFDTVEAANYPKLKEKITNAWVKQQVKNKRKSQENLSLEPPPAPEKDAPAAGERKKSIVGEGSPPAKPGTPDDKKMLVVTKSAPEFKRKVLSDDLVARKRAHQKAIGAFKTEIESFWQAYKEKAQMERAKMLLTNPEAAGSEEIPEDVEGKPKEPLFKLLPAPEYMLKLVEQSIKLTCNIKV